MIRSEKFLISQRPYAVDLASLETEPRERLSGSRYYSCFAQAAWFRRRSGRTAACLGALWCTLDAEPRGIAEFLRRHDDGRYGGDCRARWDGETFWAHQPALPDVTGPQLEFLKAMLENYPAVPPGHDGWWRFR